MVTTNTQLLFTKLSEGAKNDVEILIAVFEGYDRISLFKNITIFNNTSLANSHKSFLFRGSPAVTSRKGVRKEVSY